MLHPQPHKIHTPRRRPLNLSSPQARPSPPSPTHTKTAKVELFGATVNYEMLITRERIDKLVINARTCDVIHRKISRDPKDVSSFVLRSFPMLNHGQYVAGRG